MNQLLGNLNLKGMKQFLFYLRNRPHYPYHLSTLYSPPESVSDIFAFSSIYPKIEFIAENIRSLLAGKPIEVTHTFTFFDALGSLCKTLQFQDSQFFSRLTLDPQIVFDHVEPYLTFTHHVESLVDINTLVKSQNMHVDIERIIQQNRGYTIFCPYRTSPFGSVVHGNFGAVPPSLIPTASQRALRVYTPPYEFYSSNYYHLIFTNPTSSYLSIKVCSFDQSVVFDFTILPLGNHCLQLDNFSGFLSFYSKLCICRPLIFKNPPPYSQNGFDVLHS